MSAQLTLLLLCDQHEPYFLFVSALKSAGFQVVIARTAVRAMRFVSTTRVDAILILDSDGGDGDAVRGYRPRYERTAKGALRPEVRSPEA